MSSGLLNIVTFLPSLLVLVAQGIGLASMGKSRSGGWRLMVAGTVVSSLTVVASVLFFVVRITGGAYWGDSVLMVSYIAHLLGGILFAAGFGWHAFAVRAAGERLQQLETLTAAMAEELRGLRGEGK